MRSLVKHFMFLVLMMAVGTTTVWGQNCNIVAVPDNTNIYIPTQIANGDFSTPPSMAGSGNNRIPNGTNQGWNTTEVGDQCFEYLCDNPCGHAPGLDNHCSVEMNADNEATLYQDLFTNGGDVIRWSLQHAVRYVAWGVTNPKTQAIRVEVGAPNYDESNIVYPHGIGGSINTEINAETKVTYIKGSITNPDPHTYGYVGQESDLDGLCLDRDDNQDVWYTATGVYAIPNGQDVTRFAFVSYGAQLGECESCGNLLDNISFSTLIGDVTASYGPGNSVILSGFWGEDSSGKKLVVEIGGNTYEVDMSGVTGQNFTVTIPSECLGDEYTEVSFYHEDYESAKRTLGVNYSMTATATGVETVVDGNAYSITVNVTEPTDGYTILYGHSAQEINLTENPTFSTVGNHPVYYMITKQGYTTVKGVAYVNILPVMYDVTVVPNYSAMGSILMNSTVFASDFNSASSLPDGWTTSGPAWSVSGGCLKSGAAADNQTSSLYATVTITGSGSISFKYRISSESYCDWGEFYIDGTRKIHESGNGSWTNASYDLSAGSHTLIWSYSKDGSVDENEDKFYVDDIVITSLAPVGTTPMSIESGTTIDFVASPTNDFAFVNWTDADNNIIGTSATLPHTVVGNTTITANFDIQGHGTQDDPYLVPSTEVWNYLCANIQAGERYTNKYFRQTADITISERMSTFSEYGPENVSPPYSGIVPVFEGIYDGYGHILNLDIHETEGEGHYIATAAPFGCVNNSTIKNLHLTGEVSTNNMRPASIVGYSTGSNSLINCWSEVALSSSYNNDIDGGAFVARVGSNAHYDITGCLFTGSITYSNATGYEGGGFVGWMRDGSSVTLTDCVFAPSAITITKKDGFSMFAGGSQSKTLNNCYYNDVAAAANLTLVGPEKRIYSITPVTGLTVTPAGTPTISYDVSTISIYGDNGGLSAGGVLYGKNADVVSMNLSGAHNYTATTGTLAGTVNPYTLTMAAANSVINFVPVASVTTSSSVTSYYGTLESAVSAWEANSTLTLLADVTTSSTIDVSNTSTLDLNGHGIKMTGSGSVFRIASGKTFTLNDSDPTTTHRFSINTSTLLATLDEENGTLVINGGYITGGYAIYGCAINCSANNNAHCVMNGGTLIGNRNNGLSGNDHTVVCVARDAVTYENTFTMNGGAICYNDAGGIGLIPAGSATISNATIHHNNGVGIHMWATWGLTLNNVEITHNKGGGINLDTRITQVHIQGRTIISDNTKNSNPADICFNDAGDRSRPLAIDGTLHSEAYVGIYYNTANITPGVFTEGLDGNGNASNFFSNLSGYGVKINSDGEALLAVSATITSAPTAITGLIYSGSAQALVNAGTATGGTMKYSLDNSTWSASVPMATAAGTYTVYYMVEGDATHANIIPSSNTVEVTIVATVSMAEGTEDMSHWSLSPNQATAGTTINVDYSGSKTVERVVARRKYANIIDLNSTNGTTAQDNFNGTANSKIVASENFNAGLIFTRTEGEIDLNGHANSSWFCVQNNVVGQAITIRNGSFTDIDGTGGWGTCFKGTVILENINCNTVYTDGHDYVIRGGSYQNISNYYNGDAPGTVSIYDGKFNAFNTHGHNPNTTLDGTYTLYGGMYKFNPATATNCTVIIPDGYSVQLNPDVDNRDYPWAVVKNSNPYEATSEPNFDLNQVADNQWSFSMPAYNVEVEVNYAPDMSYTVEMASGTIDATNWSITSSPAQKGTTVELNYGGAIKVENVSLLKGSATLVNASNASTLQSSINDPTVEHPYVVLTENIPCLGNVFITKQEGTVDLSGYNMCANLYIQNDILGKTLTLRNGHIQGGADGDGGCDGSRRGTVVLDNMVIDGDLWCDGHEFYIYNTTIGGNLQNIQFNGFPSKVTIFSGHFAALRHSCGNYQTRGQYVVYGGKFKEDYSSWNICAPGYSFQANTDEDAATYPYVVLPTSTSPAPTNNSKNAPAAQPGYDVTEVTPNSKWTFTMPASNVKVLVEYGLSGQGTEEDPYVIPSLDVWNVFATCVANGNTYANKLVRQTEDISGVTKMVGTSSYRFSGTYDGDNHKMTLAINSTAEHAAPFALITGATIKNLHTAGTINTSNSFAGSIVGEALGNSKIINCLSTVTLTSSKSGDCTHGGLVGVSNGTTIEGCVFNGSLLTTNNTNNCGGLVGWSQTNNPKTIITDCLFDPVYFTPSMATDWSATIGRDGGNSGSNYTITNTYYTQAFGHVQAKEAHSISAGDGVTVANAGTATEYNVSGITSYGTGIKYGGALYGGQGDAVSLNLNGSNTGKYAASSGTLTGNSNPYTLTMAAANSVISEAVASVTTSANVTTYYSIFSDAVSAWVDGSTLTLLADVTTTSTISRSSGTYTLDLNGFGIKMLSSTYGGSSLGNVFNVGSGGILTIQDENPATTTHYYTITDAATNGAGLAKVVDEATYNAASGSKGTFLGGYITGGRLADDYTYGAGIFVHNGGQLNMNGGTVIGNELTYSKTGGGGIEIEGAETRLYINAGNIIGNRAGYGGALYVRSGRAEFHDGLMKYNVAHATCGGAVHVYNSNAYFTMSGGTLSNNKAACGGALEASGSGTITLTGGSIVDNLATIQGGALTNHRTEGDTKAKFYLSSNVFFSGNKLNTNDNQIYLNTSTSLYKLNITGALSNTTSIGVAMTTPGVFTTGYGTHNSAHPSTYFHSENAGYIVGRNTSGEAYLHTPYTVTYGGNDGGTVPTDANTYAGGVTVTIPSTVPTRTGYTFTGWLNSVDNNTYASGAEFTITGNTTLTAQWTINSYTITASADPTGDGTVSGSGNYDYGAEVTLTATPATDYHFVHWLKDDETEPVSTDATYIFTVTEDATYTATFAIDEYRIDSIRLTWQVKIGDGDPFFPTPYVTESPTDADTMGYLMIPVGAEFFIIPSGAQKPLIKNLELIDKTPPTGAINGKFTINESGDQVYFSQGNLQATTSDLGANWSWTFAENQWDYIGNAAANNCISGIGTVSTNGTVDLYGWSASATNLGIHNSTDNSTYYGDFVDWGSNATVQAGIGTGWRTLTLSEWTYVFNTRTSGSTVNGTSDARYTHATINTDGTGVNGMILFPDGITVADSEATLWGTINDNSSWGTKCTSAQWTALESKGCVFLPTAGIREFPGLCHDAGDFGDYWSSSPSTSDVDGAYSVTFYQVGLDLADDDNRSYGCSVRLVKDAE